MNNTSNLKIGVCGLACSECPAYTSDKCKECSPNIPEHLCPLPTCAQQKSAKLCFDCQEFPCEKNYKGGPIVTSLLDHWKKQKSE